MLTLNLKDVVAVRSRGEAQPAELAGGGNPIKLGSARSWHSTTELLPLEIVFNYLAESEGLNSQAR